LNNFFGSAQSLTWIKRNECTCKGSCLSLILMCMHAWFSLSLVNQESQLILIFSCTDKDSTVKNRRYTIENIIVVCRSNWPSNQYINFVEEGWLHNAEEQRKAKERLVLHTYPSFNYTHMNIWQLLNFSEKFHASALSS
jgi:hypothetical protein